MYHMNIYEQAGLSRATLEMSSLNFPYEIWFLLYRITKGLNLNLNKIRLEVAQIYFDCLVWLHKPNVSKSYSTFNILRSPSIGCVFILSNFQFWFGPEALCFNLENIWSVVDEIFHFKYFKVDFNLWSSSFQAFLNFGLVP